MSSSSYERKRAVDLYLKACVAKRKGYERKDECMKGRKKEEDGERIEEE